MHVMKYYDPDNLTVIRFMNSANLDSNQTIMIFDGPFEKFNITWSEVAESTIDIKDDLCRSDIRDSVSYRIKTREDIVNIIQLLRQLFVVVDSTQ